MCQVGPRRDVKDVFVSILCFICFVILSSRRKVELMKLCTFRAVVVAWPFASELTAHSQPKHKRRELTRVK